MNDIITTLLISVGSMGAIGVVYASILVLADKKLRVEEDPRVERVMDVLPMTNCGACGAPGCLGFAEGLIEGKFELNGCIPGGQEVIDHLAELLGMESMEAQKIVAVLVCRGGDKETTKSASYRGEPSCLAADLTGGEKDCKYACLGYGDCVDSCEFDAMAMDDNGLPVIFFDKCVGCTDCAEICPRDVIEMHPVENKLFVYCKSKDKGGVSKKNCTVACIGCNICVKDCDQEGGIIIEENLAIINYDICAQDDIKPTEKCPTKCILLDEEPKRTAENFYASKIKEAS